MSALPVQGRVESTVVINGQINLVNMPLPRDHGSLDLSIPVRAQVAAAKLLPTGAGHIRAQGEVCVPWAPILDLVCRRIAEHAWLEDVFISNVWLSGAHDLYLALRVRVRRRVLIDLKVTVHLGIDAGHAIQLVSANAVGINLVGIGAAIYLNSQIFGPLRGKVLFDPRAALSPALRIAALHFTSISPHELLVVADATYTL